MCMSTYVTMLLPGFLNDLYIGVLGCCIILPTPPFTIDSYNNSFIVKFLFEINSDTIPNLKEELGEKQG